MAVNSREPLVDKDVDLRDFPNCYIPISITQDSLADVTDAVFRAALILALKSWHQVPAASLPNHDLHRFAEVPRETWSDIKRAALRGFDLCSDGRWYHRDLAERAKAAWAKKRSNARRIMRRLEIESEKWAILRAAIFARDSYTCRYCGLAGVRIECDHVVPVCRGGDTVEDNLVTACKPCNRSKGSKLLSEWRR